MNNGSNSNSNSNSNNIGAEHAGLIERFSRVADLMIGVVSFMWLPGHGRSFDGRPRAAKGTRPLALTLEVGEGGALTLAGAIARPAEGRLRFSTLFKFDFGDPRTVAGNAVAARRGLNLLAALTRAGERAARALRQGRELPALDAPEFPRVMVPIRGPQAFDAARVAAAVGHVSDPTLRGALAARLREPDLHAIPGLALGDARAVRTDIVAAAINAATAFENYGPVLGAPHRNPARRLAGTMRNPAPEIYAELGVDGPDAATAANVDQLVGAFRLRFPLGERLSLEQICDALAHPQVPLEVAPGFGDIPDARVIAAMRAAAADDRQAQAASDADLLAASKAPDAPLYLGHLSRMQVVLTADLAVLPEPYAGDFLTAHDAPLSEPAPAAVAEQTAETVA